MCVDGINQILPVTMADQAKSCWLLRRISVVVLMKDIVLLRDFLSVILVCVVPLNADRKKVLLVMTVALDLFFWCLRSLEDMLTKVLVFLGL